MGNILVLVELHNGKARKASLSGITFARDLGSKTGRAYEIAVMGPGAQGAAAGLTGFGAAKVHWVESPAFEHYLARPWARVNVRQTTEGEPS